MNSGGKNNSRSTSRPLLNPALLQFVGMMEHQKTDWRMYLNNYLQSRYGHTRRLTWSCTQSGPPHDIRWQAIVCFDGIEYGNGIARDRGAAMEIAAEAAYRALTVYCN